MAWTLYNARKMAFYSECMGRQEEFLFSLPNFFDERPYKVNRIDLPLLDPYRFFINIPMLTCFFIVPIFYILIFRFRKQHDMTIAGENTLLAHQNLIEV